MNAGLDERKAARGAERKAVTNPWAIAGTLVIFSGFIFVVPVFAILLPIVVVGMVVLYLVSQSNTKKAQNLARRKLGSGNPGAEISVGAGNASSFVLNDWGLVYVTPGSSPTEISWSEVSFVEEPETAVLSIHSRDRRVFSVDLCAERFFLVTRAICARIPGATNLDIDPLTGRSRLLKKLSMSPRSRSGKWGEMAVSEEGIQYSNVSMRWDEVESVVEDIIPARHREDYDPVWRLTFSAPGQSFTVTTLDLSDGRIVGYGAYDWVRAVTLERLQDRMKPDWARMIPTPWWRARREFDFCKETIRAAFALAMKKGKLHMIESNFQHMLTLVDTFTLEDDQSIKDFFLDYAALLSRTGRAEEAAAMEARSV